MSDHQPERNCEPDSDAGPAPADGEREASKGRQAADLPEPDFSRLKMALASLDAAFPER